MTYAFPTPHEAQEQGMKRLLANPQLPIFRKQVQAQMDRAMNDGIPKQFTVSTAGIDSAVVRLVSEELRQAKWVVTPDNSAKNEPFILVRPVPAHHGVSQL